jgi:type IV pilus assembly protein PilY1
VSGTTTQPITTKPELSQISYQGANYVVVYVATGSYLGMSDLSTTGTQTIYGFKDLLGSTPLGDLRASNTLVKQTLTTNGLIRTATKNAVDWDSKGGWMVDLPSSGERVNVDMTQALNVLSVASTIPSSSACDSGGTSWIYKLDIASGAAVSGATDNAAGLLFKEGVLIVGQTIVQLTDGSTSTIYMPSNDETPFTRPDAKADSNMPVHRTSWRELAN